MSLSLTRRRFIGAAALGGGWLAASVALPFVNARAASPRLRVAFFTDVHARTEWDTPIAMMKAAQAINDIRPDLVIGGGDYITEGFESPASRVASRWLVFREMMDSVRGDKFLAIGNHDLVAAMPADGSPPSPDPKKVFRDLFSLERTYYALDAGGYHIVFLDSVEVVGGDLKYRGFIDAAQMEWLEAELDRVPHGKPIVAVLHIPVLTTFYQATEGGLAATPANRVVVNNRELLAAFEGHNLILVLQGHLHVLEAVRWRHTLFLMGGAVCGKWWRGPWQGTEEGFCVVDLEGDQVRWRYVDYGWEARRPSNQ
jgi:3',5'-cyclic AMP phosphodiesterase CpdA